MVPDEVRKSVSQVVANVIEGIAVAAKGKFDELAFDLESGFCEYADVMRDHCSKTKTLIHRAHPIPIDDIHVSPTFRIGNKRLTEREVLDYVLADGKLIVTGNAGAGKTIFLKWLYLRILENNGFGFPIFIELRHLREEEQDNFSLVDYSFHEISRKTSKFTLSQFKYGLKKGAFTILLDGFDELPADIREKVTRDAQRLAGDFPRAAIVLTSRPNPNFASWDDFSIAQALDFNIGQVRQLVIKTDFDDDKKAAFLQDLKAGLYERRRSFLANPLLATMMLLIHDVVGEIPKQLHVFYEKSFEVLSREHDTLKSRFHRKLHSGVSVEDLKEIFEAFCALTYMDHQYQFRSADQFRGRITEALDYLGLGDSLEPYAVAQDFTESLSVIAEDGGAYNFIHRSFQEYFFAKFIVREFDSDSVAAMKEALDSMQTPQLIHLLYGLNASMITCQFLLPEIKELRRLIGYIDPHTDPVPILSVLLERIELGEVEHVLLSVSESGGASSEGDDSDSSATVETSVDFTATLASSPTGYRGIVDACTALGFCQSAYPVADDVVSDGRHSSFFKEHGEVSFDITEFNRDTIIELGGGYFAKHVLETVSAAESALESYCSEHGERRSRAFRRRRQE